MDYEAREDSVTEDSFDQIGAELNAARLAKGIQINDLSQHLRISRHQLKSIEAGEFDALPGPTYAAGYLRSFALEVGLDPVALTQRYRALLNVEDKGPTYSFPVDTQRPQRSGAMLASILVIFAVGGYGAWYAIGKPDVLTALTGDSQPEIAVRPQIESTATEPDDLANRDAEPNRDAEQTNLAASPVPSLPDSQMPVGPEDEATSTAATTITESTAPLATSSEIELAEDAGSAQLPVLESDLASVPAVEGDTLNPVATGPTDETGADNALAAITATGTGTETGTETVADGTGERAAADGTATDGTAADTMTTTLAAGMTDDRLVTGTPDSSISSQIGTGVAFARQRVPDMEITLRATGASWVEIIRNNGEEVMAKLMRNGETYMIDSRDRLYLSTGNAGGLEIVFSDGTARSIGESGEILRDLLLDVDKLRNQF